MSTSLRFSSIIFVLLSFFITLNSLPSFADHWKTVKYQRFNSNLLQSKKAELLKKNDLKEPNVFYIGVGLWGNEPWSTNDAIGIGKALKKFYPKRNLVEIILSNDEKNNMPYVYPSFTALPRVVQEVSKYYKKNDLVIIGLYSHGVKKGLVVRLGKKGHKVVGINQNFIKGDILKPLLKKRAKIVLILSACYSGALVKSLRHPNIVVASSADADKVSFGCNTKSSNTFYASSLISDLIRRSEAKNYSIVDVLNNARRTVQAKEANLGYPRSNPLIFMGKDFNKSPKNYSKNVLLKSEFLKLELDTRKIIQKKLKDYGLYSSSIDGFYGGGTEAGLLAINEKWKFNIGKAEQVQRLFSQLLPKTSKSPDY